VKLSDHDKEHLEMALNGYNLSNSLSPNGNTNVFNKSNYAAVAFVATGGMTATTQCVISLDINLNIYNFPAGINIVMPTLIAGTDYAIYACTDNTIRADANYTIPVGYISTTSRKIGGFHYAPGGNATANSGGNTTPAINPYSFWDLKFRPRCADPRGMALIANSFWSDIYLLNTDTDANGTSKYGVTIADGASPPKKPLAFGGDGSAAYASLNWWEASEVLTAFGKRLASYQEYAALAFGTTEASSIGADQNTTQLNASYTSKWGIMQSTGVIDVWGSNFGGGSAGASWAVNTNGRGSTYQLPNAARFGGNWTDGAYAGSRSSFWNIAPTVSDNTISGRGVCDHLSLD